MNLLPSPRRHASLDALFARAGRGRTLSDLREPVFGDLAAPAPGRMAEPGAPAGRRAAEMALEAGEHRLYAPRAETQVLELRARR